MSQTVHFKGNPVTVANSIPQAGSKAQTFTLVAKDLSDITLSTFRNAEFLQAYGVAIADGPLKGLAARAVVVIDENDNVIFSQLVDEITTEPDYEAALAVLKA